MLETALFGLVNNVLKSITPIFTKLTPMIYYGTDMNPLNFEVKRPQFNVMVM